jgi:hypothetical protein
MKIICVIIKEKEKIMSDLSNITQFSGITITSDQTTGTNNPNATFTVANLTQEQIKNLQNVTPYVVNEETVKIKEGTIIFNISVDKLQMFRNGGWESITTNISTATGVGLSSSPFSIPSGTKANVEVASNQVNGFIYNDTTNNQVRGYINSKWMTLFSVVTTANTGLGLTTGAPFIYPSGSRVNVEVAANQLNGFTYYDVTNSVLRTYKNAWQTITSA